MKNILRRHKSDIALIIGNGINRYGGSENSNSWGKLLGDLAERYLPSELNNVAEGVSLTEFYDLLDLKASENPNNVRLQKEFCSLMEGWSYDTQHKSILGWCVKHNVPILTSNFEKVLSKAGGCSLFRIRNDQRFTDFYPWESYYANVEISNPCDGFGIWHINGMERHYRSIRLGLTHYMGSVERARSWIHKGNESRLFSGKNVNGWKGAHTWLHIIFNKPLLIFGLGLEQNEVFFRWLLIERARYFNKYPERRKLAWYVYKKDELVSGKKYFLEGVGIKPIQVESHQDIYGDRVWA